MQLSQFAFPLLLFFLLFATGCASLTKRITRTLDLAYVPADEPTFDSVRHRLDVYAPRRRATPKKVLVFIHGGNWNSGSKDLYRFLGSRMARKGVVTAIINYRLSPQVHYPGMATDATLAVKWVKENIGAFGGDPNQIFVSGHSAGGHLAGLITVREQYFDSLGIESPVKGAILIDAAGLDMYTYLREKQFAEGHTYLQTFTANPEMWKEASVLYHLHPEAPPLLIYRGGRTYPSIIKSHKAFLKAYREYVPAPNFKIQRRKRHIPMIVQFIFTWNPRYKEMLRFMDSPAESPFR